MNRMGWILLAGLLAGCGSAAVPADDAAAPPDDGIVEDAATAEDAGGEPEDSSGPDGCGSPDGGRPEVGAVRVATWRGGAPAAGSLTFDDTDPSHLPYGVPLLEERGLVGTFYLIVSSVSPDEWADWLPLLDRGHEIGSHTCNHGHLAEVDHGDVVREIVWSKNMLEWVTGRPVLTLGYPYSNENAWVRRAVGTYYVAARSGPEGDLSVNPPRPADIHRLRSFIPLGDGDLGAMLADVDEAMETGGWMILMIHGIEDLGYCCHTSRDVFGTVFDAMVEAGMWIGTVADVSRYLLERDAASVRWEAVAPDRVRVVLSVAPLPCEHCTIPLTVEVVLPDGWEDARVAGAEPGSWIVVETGEGRVLRFEMRAPESTAEVVQVCPDGGDDGDGGEDADRDRGEVGDDAGWGDDAPGDDGTDATEESSLSGTIRLDGSVVCGAEAHSDCAGSVAVAAFPCPELGMCPPIKVAPVDRSDLSAGPVDYRVARLPSDVEFWVLAVLLEDEEGRAVRMPMGGDLVSSDGVLASVTIPRGETATLDLPLRRLE
jgi:peptidoglycan/xylan/chitin deacetylase (PgdA/CDA1 family)